MTEEGQRSLGEFEADPEDRPDAEAEAIAGRPDTEAHAVVDPEREAVPDAEGTVEIAVVQVDYTVEGAGRDQHPIVHVFGRTTDDDLEHVRVRGFRPYFYAPTGSLDDEALDRDAITGTQEGFESIRGEKLTRIYGRTPRDVGSMRDDFEHYEADILFPNRLLIDKDIRGGVRVPERRAEDGTLVVPHDELEPTDVDADPRVCMLDIEVDDRRGFPEDGEEPIVCLTTHDSYRDEYVAWLYEAPEFDGQVPEDLPDYEQIGEESTVEVRAFGSEPAMLDALISYIEEIDADLLSGWNFEDFDAPYLLDRLERLDDWPDHDYDLSVERLSRVGEVWRSGWGGPDVKGRVVFDLLYAYKRTQYSELESYRLDAVGEMELDVGKERYPGDIGDLWEDDPERLLEYNVRDVELCVEINREQDVIPFWQDVASFIGCKLEDAPTPGDAVDMYVLHEAYGEFVLPSKGQQEAEEFEGGAVFEPITGVRDMVSVLDLKCFSGDTDVVTPEGVRTITDLDVGDEIYTLDPDTFECEVSTVVETHEYDNRFGELHHLRGEGYDLKVTENHRLLYGPADGSSGPADFAFAAYRDVPEGDPHAFPEHAPVDGRSPETFEFVDDVEEGNVAVYTDADPRALGVAAPGSALATTGLVYGSAGGIGGGETVDRHLLPMSTFVEQKGRILDVADEAYLTEPSRGSETPLSFGMDDWLELVGWYVAAGTVDPARGQVTIRGSEEDAPAVQDLLDRMGIDYAAAPDGVGIPNSYLAGWFHEHCVAENGARRLPEWVSDLDGRLLTELLETLIRGQGIGNRTSNGRTFWTESDGLKRDVVDLAVRCGHRPTVTEGEDGTWYVSVGEDEPFRKSTNATVEDHDGTVYCVTAEDNHVVLAGRNGRYQWVGQSLYPMSMVTINASPETKVDPETYDEETYRTPNDIHFRKEPDGIIREMVDALLSEREEKKELRNQYDPGSEPYERYDRQQGAVKVIMNCFTPDTEVLTPDGVRNIRDLSVGDDVYSLDPDSMEMEVKPVTETHEYPDYRGEVVDIETSKIDFRVTPNHRMLVRKNEKNGITEDEYSFVEAGDLDGATNYELPHDWSTSHGTELDRVDLTELLDDGYEVWVRPEVHGHTFAAEIGYYPEKVLKNDIGKEGYVFSPEEFEAHREYIEDVAQRTYVHAESGRKWIPRTFDGDDFLDLLAWYVTEGNVYTSDEKQFGDKLRGSATSIKIAQERALADGGTDDHAAIGDLLDRMGFDYYVDDRSYQFTSKLLGELLERICGADSHHKRIPEIVFECSRRQKRRFLDTLIDGDGDRQPNSWRYTTSSEQLRDDVLRLAAHLGLTTSYNHNGGAWRIYCTEDGKNTLRMHRSGGASEAENGVYCVTVEDNHTLLAGRNGKFQFVGQSLYGVFGWDRFRLYDREMSAGVTATNREVISFTEETVDDLGHSVTYGDTDSVMIELGDRISKGEAIDTSFDIEEAINQSYDEFTRDRLNAEDHRFQIEFEKLYRRFFQAGKKKRYAGHIVWKEGKDVDDIDITGFEYQRSDIAPITKRVQREVIEMIVTGEDIADVKDYVADVIEDYKAGNVDLDDVGIPGGIGKRLDAYDTDTAQVRGAKYANLLLGTNFGRGSKPKRLYLEKNGIHPDYFERIDPEIAEDPLFESFKRDVADGDGVICFEYADQVPEELEIDWDKMLDKTLKGPIARVLEALDVSWEEVETGQQQTGLGNFM